MAEKEHCPSTIRIDGNIYILALIEFKSERRILDIIYSQNSETRSVQVNPSTPNGGFFDSLKS